MTDTTPKREEQIKQEVAKRYFSSFDTTAILGNEDFSIAVPMPPGQQPLFETEYLLLAGAKRGTTHHIEHSLGQLIITIGKARTYLHHLPPAFLGTFDEEKIAFIPYYRVADIFTAIYQKWRAEVMPTIWVNWDEAKKQGVIAADFTDQQEAHRRFWMRYDRPTRREYWNYIVERRDLLVPQDVRECRGSFFTPQRWVALSQQYLVDELGNDWQDKYYIKDCCVGTGNLLAGLTNKYSSYASTLDQQDVDVMNERTHNMEAEVGDASERRKIVGGASERRKIVGDASERRKIVGDVSERREASVRRSEASPTKGSNLLESHVFQFDFFNDPFFHERDKKGHIVKRSKVPDGLQKILADTEARKRLVIYINPPYAEAADRKTVVGKGHNKQDVAVRQDTYYIWNTGSKHFFKDIYNDKSEKIGKKTINVSPSKTINDWIITTRNRDNEASIGYLSAKGSDFQNNNDVNIVNDKRLLPHPRGTIITSCNITEIAVYYSSRDGANHWIPFTEEEVDAQERFDSHRVGSYLRETHSLGSPNTETDLFSSQQTQPTASYRPFVHLSAEASAVMDAGRELWRYYRQQPGATPNASHYDIRLHFQAPKLTATGKEQMNPDSADAHYATLLPTLRQSLRVLAAHVEPKVYQHGFLK